ncbi:hypothetical protein HPB50_014466 [Hyalomma asiaticum]|uniref:Uncharacterized protein n=1 Tax=Hyalomma asiaticum TaxID=266040 RepID=A0ACB7T6Y6_HYAAI|nr:hypothetical protein HPB50_014466 [Hyalomma asiaticum]
MAFVNGSGLGMRAARRPARLAGPNEASALANDPFGLDLRLRPLIGPRPVAPASSISGDNFATRFSVQYSPYSTARNMPAGNNVRPPAWRHILLPSYPKYSYGEHNRTAQRSPEEVGAFRNANEITVMGSGVPKPLLSLEEASFPEPITKVIEGINTGSSPTPLQAQCWPVALKGRDFVAVDRTESKGKSLAYLVPAVVHVQHQPPVVRGGGPTVLVLTATREQAQQLHIAVRQLTEGSGIRTMYLVSGDPKQPQLKQLEDGADICVATPGRLKVFMEMCKVNLRGCTLLAIDELDSLLTMGFGKELTIITRNVRPDRQTLVGLAWGTNESREFAEKLTKDSVKVSVGMAPQEHEYRRVEHVIIFCEEAEKENKLVELLKDILTEHSDRAVVFVDRKQTVEELPLALCRQGLQAVGTHGQIIEQEHKWAMDALQRSEASILVATDVTTRPLVLDNVHYVVSYDYPIHPNDYARRFGYAARSNGAGRKYTFLLSNDRAHARELLWFLRENKLSVPPQLRDLANKAPRK